MSTRCEICGSPAVDVREMLTFRSIPLGVFKVRKCLGSCKEEVFPHAAWKAMEAIEKALASSTNPLISGWIGLDKVSIAPNPLDLASPVPLVLEGSTPPTVGPLVAVRLLESSY